MPNEQTLSRRDSCKRRAFWIDRRSSKRRVRRGNRGHAICWRRRQEGEAICREGKKSAGRRQRDGVERARGTIQPGLADTTSSDRLAFRKSPKEHIAASRATENPSAIRRECHANDVRVFWMEWWMSGKQRAK